mmetsp:Transcript_16191/g.32520  ORF Transcript_16191/g.32520 Transcript_16191/m.32520 type:complete len:267 (+) Transcript_16191:210-1010(+)
MRISRWSRCTSPSSGLRRPITIRRPRPSMRWSLIALPPALESIGIAPRRALSIGITPLLPKSTPELTPPSSPALPNQRQCPSHLSSIQSPPFPPMPAPSLPPRPFPLTRSARASTPMPLPQPQPSATPLVPPFGPVPNLPTRILSKRLGGGCLSQSLVATSSITSRAPPSDPHPPRSSLLLALPSATGPTCRPHLPALVRRTHSPPSFAVGLHKQQRLASLAWLCANRRWTRALEGRRAFPGVIFCLGGWPSHTFCSPPPLVHAHR